MYYYSLQIKMGFKTKTKKNLQVKGGSVSPFANVLSYFRPYSVISSHMADKSRAQFRNSLSLQLFLKICSYISPGNDGRL
jgi:hypothetical protein